MTIRMFEAFAGYGSQLMAMKRLARETPGLEVVPVGISEIDPYAVRGYEAVHGPVDNYGDITKIDWDAVPDFDLFTYSFPCQDISSAGQQRGLDPGSGTRSSLLWECQRAIDVKRPKYLLMENVAALTQDKFRPQLNRWLAMKDAPKQEKIKAVTALYESLGLKDLARNAIIKYSHQALDLLHETKMSYDAYKQFEAVIENLVNREK